MNYQATREIRTFDAEGYINEVFEKYAGTVNEESREALQRQWDATLSMPRGGDASLYPNAHGQRPALLEVWHKAGDFWRANGFSKPARLLCDQNGIVIDEETAQKIAAAKSAISGTDNADYDPGIIVPEIDTTTPTPRRRSHRRDSHIPTSVISISMTETTETTTTTPHTRPSSGETHSHEAISILAMCVGTLAALIIIWKCGLIIPCALLGGIAGGFIK